MRSVGRGARAERLAKWGVLLAGIALAWPGRPVAWTSALLPSLSPLVAACSLLATQAVAVLMLLAVPALVACLLRPRFLCRYACPLGLLQEGIAALPPRPRAPGRPLPPIGAWLLGLSLGGALLGYPLFLWLDPFAIFTGAINAWRRPLLAASLLPAVGLLAILLLQRLRPGAWCARVCPLGVLQDVLALPRRRRQPAPVGGRRAFLATCAGAAGALAVSRVVGRTAPLRPPGALDEARFGGVCIRCGNCAQVCPSRIIRPDLGGHGLLNLGTPVLSFDAGYCRESCARCNEVCPSGAIERLPLEAKNRRVIGIARVDLDTCLMANGRECTACIAACPYRALAAVSNDGGFTSRPSVRADLCTGCGACEAACPVRPARAVVVRKGHA